MQIDTSTEFGARVARRLATEKVAWLTTVGLDGTPQPSPVWFLWDGEHILIFSQENMPKLRNIAANPRVSFTFDGDTRGGDVIVLTGTAAVAADAPPANEIPAYLEKYGQAIVGLGLRDEQFARGYSVPIRVTPTKLRGH
ncbi:MAG: TIGR03667 family PPOX class F420-dependent oxidoreductase [Chloroflexi bacterium]|nr:TIGR03667 family PPOX class F420-dependent oxidoreductase [Chloroflexota bacterium]